MDDLISRSALIEKMNDTKIQVMFDLPVEELLGEDVDMDAFCTLLQDAIQSYRKLVIGEAINKTPTVEAKAVIHGEWEKTRLAGEYECSNCHSVEYESFTKSGFKLPNFCPNCGADMRKKVQE